jgi:hypothetical protein
MHDRRVSFRVPFYGSSSISASGHLARNESPREVAGGRAGAACLCRHADTSHLVGRLFANCRCSVALSRRSSPGNRRLRANLPIRAGRLHRFGATLSIPRLFGFLELGARVEQCELQANLPVNTDAHERPLPSVAPDRVRRLLSRYASAEEGCDAETV